MGEWKAADEICIAYAQPPQLEAHLGTEACDEFRRDPAPDREGRPANLYRTIGLGLRTGRLPRLLSWTSGPPIGTDRKAVRRRIHHGRGKRDDSASI